MAKKKTSQKKKVEIRRKSSRQRNFLIFLADAGKFCLISLIGVVVLAGLMALAWLDNRGGLLDGEQQIVFSEKSGFYEHDVTLRLSTDRLSVPDSMVIKYNLTGDDINVDGVVYDGTSIVLMVPKEGYEVLTVQAALCYVEGECGETYTETYVLGRQLSEDIDLDVINIIVDQKSLYDYDVGIMVKGRTYDEDSADGADYVRGNYNMRTEEWIRDARLVVFDVVGEKKIDKEMGIQIAGWTSAASDEKSLKLVGNKKYGYSKIQFDFGDGARLYNSLKLRSGQDQVAGRIRSAMASRLAKEAGFDGVPDSKLVTVFLNNEFYGVMDLQQNYSDSYLAQRFGLPNTGKIAKYKSSEQDVFDAAGIDGLMWSDLNVEENRKRLEEVVDMDNYLQYYAMQIMWNNTDWPSNNFEVWNYNDGREDSENPYEDGRYRFLIYDTDVIYYTNGNITFFNGVIGDQFAALMDSTFRATGSSFRNVMMSKYYADKFVEILRTLINGAFKTENVLRIVNEEAGKIDRQMKLNYSEREYNEWVRNIELIKKAVRERNDIVRQDVKKYFGKTI